MLQRRSARPAAGSEPTELFGLSFRNPVGLGAGFDKNARWLTELDILGFGFIEIGTVTPFPQAGNDQPRLFRLPKDRALINRMGFNNDGVKAVAGRLRDWRKSQLESGVEKTSLLIGGNIGKNKTTPNENAWKDYEICFRDLFDCVDYFVVNVSSPNTPGLRELQEKEALGKILTHLQTLNRQQPKPKPLLLKIAPDLSREQLDGVIELALEIELDGLVATNACRMGTHGRGRSQWRSSPAAVYGDRPIYPRKDERKDPGHRFGGHFQRSRRPGKNGCRRFPGAGLDRLHLRRSFYCQVNQQRNKGEG
jgi:dihydroorotate dehydrogenase